MLGKVDAQSVTMSVADSLYAIGNYTLAINEYAKVASTNSELQIARAYNAIGNYEKAILQYENVVEQNKSGELAKYELGRLYLKLKKYDLAKEVFSQLTERNQLNSEYYYYLGESLKELTLFSEGMAAYKHSVKLDSTHLRSLFQLGKYYVLQRERDSVVKYVDKGLDFYENDVSLINLKALANYNDNLIWLALPLFERLVELGEHKEYIFEKMGYSYFAMAKYEKAKEAYENLLTFDGKNPVALYGLGSSYAKLQELDSAKIYIKKSIEVQKVVLDKEYNALARLAVEQNDLKLAIQYYKKAFREDPAGYLYKYEVCLLTDQYYKNPKMSLKCYQEYQEQFGGKVDYFSEFVSNRILKLKEEIQVQNP